MLTEAQRERLESFIDSEESPYHLSVAIQAALTEIDASRAELARLRKDNADQAMLLHDLQQDAMTQTEAGKESERAAILETINRQRASHQVDLNVQPAGGADWHHHAGADATLETLGKEILYRSGSGNPVILPLDAMLERQRQEDATIANLQQLLRQAARAIEDHNADYDQATPRTFIEALYQAAGGPQGTSG